MTDKDKFLGGGEAADLVSGGRNGASEKFHTLQPNRDLQSNWEVDLAQKLEEYLLKICSTEVSSVDDRTSIPSINFAEAALLLQGSIQVYSRKVEYLHSLVLHALEFLSHNREEHQEKTQNQISEIESSTACDETDEQFLGLDDVPVDPKNCLEGGLIKDNPDRFLKRPTNILLLEGDCLENSGVSGELESYLLSTCNFYGDFLLIDPCDAEAVYCFLNANDLGKECAANQSGSLIRSKSRQSFFSPTGRSDGKIHKSNPGKDQNVDFDNVHGFEINNENNHFGFDADEDFRNHGVWSGDDQDVGGFPTNLDVSLDDSDIDEDPWKPLNPHEPGTLRIKPFRKVKIMGRPATFYNKEKNAPSQFPIAKLSGIVDPEFSKAWEANCETQERMRSTQSPTLYEKLRRSLVFGEPENSGDVGGLEDDYNDDGDMNLGTTEFDLSKDADYMNADDNGKGDNATQVVGDAGFSLDNPDFNLNLEELCRSHLDALLASIAENEKQTEIAMRVSDWKQRVESTLEEQDRRVPFDIHCYGEQILEKLSTEESESGGSLSFVAIVRDQPKHEVARSFSALLQLVNSGDVELQNLQFGSCEPICYTRSFPFNVKLLRKVQKEVRIKRSGKSVKSPLRRKGCTTSEPFCLPAKASTFVTAGSPDGKRRRQVGRRISLVDLH